MVNVASALPKNVPVTGADKQGSADAAMVICLSAVARPILESKPLQPPPGM
ncbi:MAG TPA: hypothetical protein VLB01_06075 [Thermodesulfobacteriota bacterium]|nr:hypothetical protein [Thermodesulfobacteriota bacterium]